MNSFFRFLLRWIVGVIFGLLLIVAVVWSMNRQSAREKWETEAAAARSPVMAEYQNQPVVPWQAGAKHVDFIKRIQDVYDVEAAKFVRDDYLQVVFSSRFDEDPQGTCQAIANLWYNETRQPSVVVDAWKGETRTANASVINGRMITPPQPTGRRARTP